MLSDEKSNIYIIFSMLLVEGYFFIVNSLHFATTEMKCSVEFKLKQRIHLHRSNSIIVSNK